MFVIFIIILFCCALHSSSIAIAIVTATNLSSLLLRAFCALSLAPFLQALLREDCGQQDRASKLRIRAVIRRQDKARSVPAAMEMHPAGVPRLVGPAGSQFSQPDFSSQFRFLPNNSTNEMSPPRSHSQPILLHASRLSGTNPFRLWGGEFKAGSPGACFSPQHSLPSSDTKLSPKPLSPPPVTISPTQLIPEDVKEADLVPVAHDDSDLHISDYSEVIHEFLMEDVSLAYCDIMYKYLQLI